MASKKSARAALAAAQQVTAQADASFTAAADDIETAARAIESAEAHAVEVLTNINNGHGDVNQEAVQQARAAVEQARRDHEWAILRHQAAEAAHRRASDAEAEARRAVTADEYRRAHAEFNNPDSRENLLLKRVREDVAELIGVINARQELHDRLARDVATWPAEERENLRIPPGKPITTCGTKGLGSWTVQVPLFDLAESLTAGIAEAAERARADAQANHASPEDEPPTAAGF